MDQDGWKQGGKGFGVFGECDKRDKRAGTRGREREIVMGIERGLEGRIGRKNGSQGRENVMRMERQDRTEKGDGSTDSGMSRAKYKGKIKKGHGGKEEEWE